MSKSQTDRGTRQLQFAEICQVAAVAATQDLDLGAPECHMEARPMCCAPVIAITGAHEPKAWQAWQAATALRMNREPRTG